MTGTPSFSVIVASHNRPQWLRRCLKGLLQLDYAAFEVIVVADDASLDQIDSSQFKTIAFNDRNLAIARNLGLANAAGEWVAFIDDDSVPEPMWLHHFAEASPLADALVGFVRGRNGISFQSRAEAVDAEAETHSLNFEGDVPRVLELPRGQALKLIGTNMCARREVLLKLGGFDPAFRYFLDDTDLSLRLMQAGHLAAVVPHAEVHHAFAPSHHRTEQRRPRQLFDIGRSSAIYFRRHPSVPMPELFERIRVREHLRLTRHMVRGSAEPRDVPNLLTDLSSGWTDGLNATLEPLKPLHETPTQLHRISTPQKGHKIVTGRLLQRGKNITEAEQFVAQGGRASVFNFSLTAVRHRVRFTDAGVWLQTGGQFGRSDRDAPPKPCTFAIRTRKERLRVAKQRGFGDSAGVVGNNHNAD